MTKILVIEDEEDIREIISDSLELAEYEVFKAANGHSGVQLAEEVLPDLILCDVAMPGLDGYGILLHLSQTPRTSRIPFIFITARATREDLRKGMSMGADDYITKPFSSQELLEAVEMRLQKFDALRVDDADLQRKQLRDYINLTLPHELRTPLTGIVGYMHMIKDGIVNDEDREMTIRMLEAMERATERLGDLIDRYMTYANVRAIMLDPILREKLYEYRLPIKLKDVIEQEAEKQTYDKKRYQDLTVELAPGCATILHGHMHKLVGEIISNALKFSKPGTPIVIRGKNEDGFYWIEIENIGRGMTQKQIENIGVNVQFDRDHYEQQGAGLGLMIAKHIAEIYDGRLMIASEPNQKTTVTIGLPVIKES